MSTPAPSSSTTNGDPSAFGLSVEEVKSLSQKSIEAKAKAYCPYSNFKVGCTLLIKDEALTSELTDRYISGANVENAAYPVGTCAERVALGTAIAAGHRFGAFKALAVATNTEPGKPASPCGLCRQALNEFCEKSMPVIMHDREGNYVVQTMEQLLPLSFGPEALPTPAQLAAHEKQR